MPVINEDFGAGGANIATPTSDGPSLAETIRALVDDNIELRTQVVALLAKLDADAGITDTDYAATLTPAALTVTKG